ncbi:MAG: diaminopimelate epimerase [Clostridia bacterium]|nr:diaminopimelate epimerase [Clostridia bacterium]
MKFVKMQGLGNDFILVDTFQTSLPVEQSGQFQNLVQQLCDRHFGIGADGLALVLPSEKAEVRMRFFNSDGSEAQMCGNMIRCFAKYVYNSGLVAGPSMQVETGAGIVKPEIIADHGDTALVRVDMGRPRRKREEIPMVGPPGEVLDEELSLEGQKLRITAISMGNPHCVLFVPDVNGVAVETIGSLLENHQLFPEKTNVEFAEVLSPGEVNLRVWERGVGETLACGTGACATVVAGVLLGRLSRRVTVHLPGGDLDIEWCQRDEHVYMTGPAVEVFRGEIEWGGRTFETS